MSSFGTASEQPSEQAQDHDLAGHIMTVLQQVMAYASEAQRREPHGQYLCSPSLQEKRVRVERESAPPKPPHLRGRRGPQKNPKDNKVTQ